jgi:histidinol-phosphate/aromatic aminotransferase/cobyric acid decarboxylase-like protein
MRFPLADWIDDHPECRFQLGSSGMAQTIRHPLPATRSIRTAQESELRERLARLHEVDPRRVFLTGGATEANAAVLQFLSRRDRAGPRRCRVRYPEYPPLFDAARELGWAASDRPGPASLALVSRPRNPEGVLWPLSELDRWAEGTRHLVVDETFREFSGTGSLAARGRPRTWVTGSFTKFYGADDLRVGFAVAPEEAAEDFARYHGLMNDTLARYSVAGALACLDALPRIRREVRTIVSRNVRVLRRALRAPSLGAPLYFDRVPGVSGETVALRCLARSVLVCPGAFFGDPSGVRLCLTRATFPRDFRAYLEVRDSLAPRSISPIREASPKRRARPRPGETDRARAGRASRGPRHRPV